MRWPFRSRIFIGSVVTAATSLLAAAALLSWQERARESADLQGRLMAEARLIARAVEGRRDVVTFDDDARRFGDLIGARVTLITTDGRVVGDSSQSPEGRAALDNHDTRPEILLARTDGVGTARRYSDTLNTEMLYVAVLAAHPVVGFVRVALPLSAVNAQVSRIRQVTLVALGVGVPLALLVAWLATRGIGEEVRAIAETAQRFAVGELTPPPTVYRTQELRTVSQALEGVAHELGARIEDLSRDRARTDAILTGMVEGVLVLDGDGRLQRINDAAAAMLELTPQAVSRRHIDAIRHPNIVAALDTALDGQPSAPVELALPKDPSRTVVARASPVPSARGGGAVLVMLDVSDIKRVDRMRQDFVANVSHELRTPLTVIRGYSEALADGPDDMAQVRSHADTIVRHATRMERLVVDLLRLARLDARQEPIELSVCDIEAVTYDIVRDQEDAIDRKSLTVRIGVDDVPTVMADPGHLHDILRNLIENAVSYTPARGTIRITSQRKSRAVEIVVADTGPGLPEADLSRVFERFYRVDKSRARPGGTGLGLAIVKHLVELHGGTVSVRNAPEGGAIFTVRLPDRAEARA